MDFETQDDQPETTRVTEVGAVLIDTDLADPIRFAKRFNRFCYEPDYPPQTPFIVELTGITDEMLKKEGAPRAEVFAELLPLVEAADLIVAHHKAFDETIFKATCKLVGLWVPEKRWLCSYSEIPYPEKFTCKKLSHLAFEHDIEVDRKKLHRADYDVEIMLKLLLHYDINKVLEYANEPWVYLRAEIPAPWVDGGVGKAKVVKLGYGWEMAKGDYKGDGKTFPKNWVKRVKQSGLQEELAKAAKLAVPVTEIR